MADEKANGDVGLCPFDKNVVNEAALEIFGSDSKGTNIPFQFPPKITSDQKQAQFNDKNLMRHEPFKIYQGSSARALTVELEYICSDSKNFDPKKVSQIERDIKSYFYRANTGFGEVEGKPRYPKVRFKAYQVVPGGKPGGGIAGFFERVGNAISVATGGGDGSKADFRLMSVDISHGPELVTIGGATHHLYTKISLSLELVTNIEPLKGSFGESSDIPKDKREAIIEGGLRKIKPEWL